MSRSCAEIQKLKLPPGVTLCVEPWMYGTDIENRCRHLFQRHLCIIELNHAEKTYYSVPCPFSPIFDGVNKELVFYQLDLITRSSKHSHGNQSRQFSMPMSYSVNPCARTLEVLYCTTTHFCRQPGGKLAEMVIQSGLQHP